MGGQEEGGEALEPPRVALSHSPQHPEEQWDGVFVSNGPGDPSVCVDTIKHIKKYLENPNHKPLFGICLGPARIAATATR